jgi:hypothetical protein
MEAVKEIEDVRKLAPASRHAVQYIAMHYLSRCVPARNRLAGKQSAPCRRADKEMVAGLLARSAPLFSETDPWLRDALTLSGL